MAEREEMMSLTPIFSRFCRRIPANMMIPVIQGRGVPRFPARKNQNETRKTQCNASNVRFFYDDIHRPRVAPVWRQCSSHETFILSQFR